MRLLDSSLITPGSRIDVGMRARGCLLGAGMQARVAGRAVPLGSVARSESPDGHGGHSLITQRRFVLLVEATRVSIVNRAPVRYVLTDGDQWKEYAMRRVFVLTLSVVLVLVLSIPAMAETQPTGVASALDRNGGSSAPGPHCHINLVASGRSQGFDLIMVGAIHQAHVETGLPTGVFQADPDCVA